MAEGTVKLTIDGSEVLLPFVVSHKQLRALDELGVSISSIGDTVGSMDALAYCCLRGPLFGAGHGMTYAQWQEYLDGMDMGEYFALVGAVGDVFAAATGAKPAGEA